MWDSSADHKHNTVLLLFADAIDPLGPAGIGLDYKMMWSGEQENSAGLINSPHLFDLCRRKIFGPNEYMYRTGNGEISKGPFLYESPLNFFSFCTSRVRKLLMYQGFCSEPNS